MSRHLINSAKSGIINNQLSGYIEFGICIINHNDWSPVCTSAHINAIFLWFIGEIERTI